MKKAAQLFEENNKKISSSVGLASEGPIVFKLARLASKIDL